MGHWVKRTGKIAAVVEAAVVRCCFGTGIEAAGGTVGHWENC